MPELPEVETARQILLRSAAGSKLVAVEVRLPKMFRLSALPDPEILVGETLLDVNRRGKILVLAWSNDLTMLMHLKLSGQVSAHRDEVRETAGHPYPDPLGEYPARTTHVSFDFDNGYTIHLSDLRQFGWIQILPSEDVDAFMAAQSFGPEANALEQVEPGALEAVFARRSVPIKSVLLDQKVIAGIGNIYVDEALHRARIHPATPANAIPAVEIPGLIGAIRWSIDQGLAIGGAKIINNIATQINGFPEVHARKGELCPVCGDTIVKTRVGQRGTYYCPTCQPDPRPVPSALPSE